SAAPAVPVRAAGPLEVEVREETVRLLQGREGRGRLAAARGDELRVARGLPQLDEERRVEVQAVDEDAGARIVEQRQLVGRQRRVAVRSAQRRALERDVDARGRVPSGEEAGEVETRLEHGVVARALVEEAHRVARRRVVELAGGLRPRDPRLDGAVDEALVAAVAEQIRRGEQSLEADGVAVVPARERVRAEPVRSRAHAAEHGYASDALGEAGGHAVAAPTSTR